MTLANAFPLAGGIVSPTSVAHNYKDAYAAEWNFNIQQQLGNNYGLMIGYFGTKGTDLNIERNYNQPINGVKPYQFLSSSSPIDPGLPLGNVLVYESDGNSSYHAMWLTLTKQLAKGLQYNVSYSLSKSIDENSRNHQGLVVQDSYNISGDRGLSDFDVRNRIVISGVYQLPFKRNRLVDGWEMSLIEQSQTGSPLNFHTSNAAFTGSANLRPSVTGPVQTGVAALDQWQRVGGHLHRQSIGLRESGQLVRQPGPQRRYRAWIFRIWISRWSKTLKYASA